MTREATEASVKQVTAQAFVPWKDLKLDVALLGFAALFVVLSFCYDLYQHQHDYFQRSGAVMLVISGYLAYRSLNKYWRKAENSFTRGHWLRTSGNQEIIDSCTLAILIIGTVVGGYGDKVFGFFL